MNKILFQFFICSQSAFLAFVLGYIIMIHNPRVFLYSHNSIYKKKKRIQLWNVHVFPKENLKICTHKLRKKNCSKSFHFLTVVFLIVPIFFALVEYADFVILECLKFCKSIPRQSTRNYTVGKKKATLYFFYKTFFFTP